jgi:hypothetical protein
MLPSDLPAWPVVFPQFRRGSDVGCFETMVSDIGAIISAAEGRSNQPSAVNLDGRALQSSCEGGPPARYDGHKGRNGFKVHGVVDALAAVSQAMMCIGLLAWVCLHHRWPKVGRAAQ